MRYLICILLALVSLVSFAAFGQDTTVAVEAVGWMANLAKFISMLPQYLNLALALLTAVIAIALVIPGEQPEKALSAVVEFLKKFSKK